MVKGCPQSFFAVMFPAKPFSRRKTSVMKWTDKMSELWNGFGEMHCITSECPQPWPSQLTEVTSLRKLALAKPWGLLFLYGWMNCKKAPFSELCTLKPGSGFDGYTLAGFQPRFAGRQVLLCRAQLAQTYTTALLEHCLYEEDPFWFLLTAQICVKCLLCVHCRHLSGLVNKVGKDPHSQGTSILVRFTV